mgnify:CR=1 FL=1
MKKFALATLLALSTSAAFAGFNGNTAQGGFQGGDQGQQLTVKQALSAKDNSMISLVGNITQQIDGDEYLLLMVQTKLNWKLKTVFGMV